MTLSDLSIGRPVLSTVMSLLIVVAGVAAFLALPVRELPDVDKPVVSISTTYLGASPEEVELEVTDRMHQAECLKISSKPFKKRAKPESREPV